MSEKRTASPKEKTAGTPKTPPAGAAQPKQRATPELELCRILSLTKPPIHGNDVRVAQEALIAAGFGIGVSGADGVYGEQTALAVRHFQSMKRLKVTGRIDEHTAKALGFGF